MCKICHTQSDSVSTWTINEEIQTEERNHARFNFFFICPSRVFTTFILILITNPIITGIAIIKEANIPIVIAIKTIVLIIW